MTERGPWRVLIANVTLAGRTGTETAARGFALGLKRAGHQPMVFAPALGGLADEIRVAGIPVVSDLDALPADPDIVHGHHHVETMRALFRFPRAIGLFVCHDRTAAASAPPLLPRIRRYVAVDLNCLERLTGDYAIAPERACVIPNAIDMDRFVARPPLPDRPRRAAVFSNYAEPGTHLDVVQAVCARHGLALDAIGAGVKKLSAAPERILGDYDLVFAKGRCALEAMAVGCAVILCDAAGLGPMVTAADVERLRWWNFGRRALHAPLDPAAVDRAIARYDAADAAAVSAFIRERSSLDRAIVDYLELYAAIACGPPATRSADEELAEALTASIGRLGALESALDAYRQPHRMPVLTNEACAGIRLRLTDCPAVFEAGETRHVRLCLENGSLVTLGTFPPHPVDLGYRWFDQATGAAIVSEAPRTVLAAVGAGDGATCTMRVSAPAVPGRYRLHIALVQEGLRWLDDLDVPIADDAIVQVVGAMSAKPT